ncbi:MAG: dienelactone hydrolase family protein [Chlamydiota bacterium]
MQDHLVRVSIDSRFFLEGNLIVPPGAKGIVLFAHGSGSSRFSPRNRYVAQVLQNGGMGTLLIDLLREGEEARFDIALLTERLCVIMSWLQQQPQTRGMKIGLFGASTGAAAALCAAAEREVAAVVSRGGRPDLAMSALGKVRAPTLLIVGGWDEPVIEMNAEAFAQLSCEKEMVIVPGATHLFEEPGALEEVAALALKWFNSKWIV